MVGELNLILSKMFKKEIINANYHAKQLQGGTLGDVKLISGDAETSAGERLQYKLVFKTQNKWDRYGDTGSWRREYDLYMSDLGVLFTDMLRWPECYGAEIYSDKIQIWMEYADGVSGDNLTVDILERAAKELGRFQGRVYIYTRGPATLKRISNLGPVDFMEADYSQWKPETDEYRFIRSDDCPISFHLRKMLIDMDTNAKAILTKIRKLPIILCQRDFWVGNIIYSNKAIFLIDWDTAGLGYLGEDIAQLIIDETNPEYQLEYYCKLIPSYYEGISEYLDISAINEHCIHEMILIKEGYRLIHRYMFGESNNVKNLSIRTLQKIYEMKDINRSQ